MSDVTIEEFTHQARAIVAQSIQEDWPFEQFMDAFDALVKGMTDEPDAVSPDLTVRAAWASVADTFTTSHLLDGLFTAYENTARHRQRRS